MTDLPIGTLFEFLGEHFPDDKTALTVAEEDQMEFIKEFADELKKASGTSVKILSESKIGYGMVEIPGIEIQIESFRDEKKVGQGSFVVKFVEGSDQLSAFAKPWSHADEAYPVHLKSQVVQMASRIKGMFDQARSKERVEVQQKQLSQQFLLQGLKGRIAPFGQKKQFDFAILFENNWIEVLIEKDGLGPASISLSMDEEERESELENLAEYINHAIAHLPYVDRVGSGSYHAQHHKESLQWYRHGEM